MPKELWSSVSNAGDGGNAGDAYICDDCGDINHCANAD